MGRNATEVENVDPMADVPAALPSPLLASSRTAWTCSTSLPLALLCGSFTGSLWALQPTLRRAFRETAAFEPRVSTLTNHY